MSGERVYYNLEGKVLTEVSDNPDLGQADRPTLMSNTREWAEYADSLAARLAQAEAALRDELDNWNPEARPTITAERDEALARLAQAERENEELRRYFEGRDRHPIGGTCDHAERLLEQAGLAAPDPDAADA